MVDYTNQFSFRSFIDASEGVQTVTSQKEDRKALIL